MNIWSIPISLANTLHFWAYVVLAVGSTATAAATITLLWTSGIREQNADQQISQAQADAAAAGERSSALQVEAAKLRLEQTQLSLELERERKARLEIESKLAVRTLGETGAATMSKVFGKYGRVTVLHAADPEAISFAREIADVLRVLLENGLNERFA